MKPKTFSAFLLFVVLAGCSTLMGSYNYNLEVRNTGTNRVSDCKITSDKNFIYEPGVLVATAGKTILGPFENSYAANWVVVWKNKSGEIITKNLDLTKAFPHSFQGRLVFTIDAENNLAYFTEKFRGQ